MVVIFDNIDSPVFFRCPRFSFPAGRALAQTRHLTSNCSGFDAEKRHSRSERNSVAGQVPQSFACADPRLSREFLNSVRPKTSQDFRLSLIVNSKAVALVRSLRATESKACDATRSAARSNSSARWIAKRVGIIRQTRRSPESRTRET